MTPTALLAAVVFALAPRYGTACAVLTPLVPALAANAGLPPATPLMLGSGGRWSRA